MQVLVFKNWGKMSSSKPKYAMSPNPSHSRNSQSNQASQSSFINLNGTEKISEWVRGLLGKYLDKYFRDFASNRKQDIVPSPVISPISMSDGNGNGAGEFIGATSSTSAAAGTSQSKQSSGGSSGGRSFFNNLLSSNKGKKVERNLKMGINVSDLEITEETTLGDDRLTYLSRIIALGAKYSVVGRTDHFIHWLVKLPSKHFDERNLARVTNVYRREVYFYSTVLQDMKLWLEYNSPTDSDNVQYTLKLNVPTCYFAHAQDSSDLGFDLIDIDTFPNPEYTLVLDDLRTQGFGKRHFSTGLTFQEAVEVMREISKFHATGWAMSQNSGMPLTQNWPELLNWNDQYKLFLDTIRQGFRHLHRVKREHVPEQMFIELIDKVLALETKLPALLLNLLKPLPPPAVTSLLHMDLWADNLLFRDGDSVGGLVNNMAMGSHNSDESTGMSEEVDHSKLPTSTTSGGGSEKKASGASVTGDGGDLDCMILDWQMISYGRISHDLGIFMMTSLDGKARRDHGMALIKFYYDTFEKIVNSFKLNMPFDLVDLLAQYKDSCLLATLLSTSRLDLIFSENAALQRFLEALEDLRDEELI